MSRVSCPDENWTFIDYEHEKQLRYRATFVTLYVSFIVLALIGNGAVMLLVIFERKLHRPTNYYIVSLCVSGK